MRVVVFHLEGNYFNNPSLDAILNLLLNNEYNVTYVSNKKSSRQEKELLEFIKINNVLIKLFYIASNKFMSKILTHIIIKLILKKIDFNGVNFVIGIDREGLLMASQAALIYKKHKVFISYEILFKHETSIKFKNMEIEASKKIDLWIVQDVQRMNCLISENNLDYKSCLIIPMGSKESEVNKRERNLSKTKKMNCDTKYVVLVGSLTDWTMVSELIECTRNWPPEWKLVLHDRYSNYVSVNFKDLESKILISKKAYSNFDELCKFLSRFHLGVAFYKEGNTKYTGHNLKFLGRSSGKIATYARAGLPIITNKQGLIATDLITYNAGVLIEEPYKITKFLSTCKLDELEIGVERYYEEVIDFANYEKAFLREIKKFDTETT